jgi:hypothetical protein
VLSLAIVCAQPVHAFTAVGVWRQGVNDDGSPRLVPEDQVVAEKWHFYYDERWMQASLPLAFAAVFFLIAIVTAQKVRHVK